MDLRRTTGFAQLILILAAVGMTLGMTLIQGCAKAGIPAVLLNRPIPNIPLHFPTTRTEQHLMDASSDGGGDAVQSTASFKISRVRLGGTYRNQLSRSPHYLVSGGINVGH
jgi:hypothetical protein